MDIKSKFNPAKNEFQLNACYALIELFDNKYGCLTAFNHTQKLYGAIDSKDLELFQQTLAA